jgi:flagellar basal-body rod protein FlgC
MSLFGIFDVACSGMEAQRIRAQLLAENIANAETTRTPAGGPYRRKDAVFTATPLTSDFASVFEEAKNAMVGVAVKEVMVDSGEPERRYQPGHPDADKDGYVAFPRLNPAEEMINLQSASRGYEANVAAINAAKDMIQKSIDLLK